MKYSPKKADLKARILYASLFVISVFCIMIDFPTGIKPILSSIGLISLVASLYLFIRFEFTSYEYILIERNGTLDFYVNKITGKRSSYVCYFPLTDACKITSYSKEEKQELIKQYKGVTFFKYNQNIFAGERYVLIFNDGSKFVAIIFEPDKDFVFHVQNEITRLKSLPANDDEENGEST